MAFVLVLSCSRLTFLRFYLDACMGNFLREHVERLPPMRWFGADMPVRQPYVGGARTPGECHPLPSRTSHLRRILPHRVVPTRGGQENEKGRASVQIVLFAIPSWFAHTLPDLGDA
ncbi:MAG: hypothetical protein ACYDGU_06840 [Acidiferrobacterales bacterium]